MHLGSPHRLRTRGFTLLELLVALTLLGLMSAVLFGSLNLAGRSWEAGEAKSEATSGMRLAGGYLRTQLASQHPQRMRRIPEFPLLFAGEREELRYTASLPGRVGLGGIWYHRLTLAPGISSGKSALVIERVIPNYNATTMPDFADAERSVLADDIKELKRGYFGRDVGLGPEQDSSPTWRDRWDNPHSLPLLIRIDITPARGPAWPTLVVAPREAPEAGCRGWDAVRQRCVA